MSVEISGSASHSRRALGSVGGGGDDLDLRLLERRVELVHLAGVEVELVERERDLVGVERAGRPPGLEQGACLVGVEDILDGTASVRFPIRCAQDAPFRRVALTLATSVPSVKEPSAPSSSDAGRVRARRGSACASRASGEPGSAVVASRSCFFAWSTAGPEEEQTEVEAHGRRVREAAGERPEPRERGGRVGLVEAPDGGCDERLGVVAAPARRAASNSRRAESG